MTLCTILSRQWRRQQVGHVAAITNMRQQQQPLLLLKSSVSLSNRRRQFSNNLFSIQSFLLLLPRPSSNPTLKQRLLESKKLQESIQHTMKMCRLHDPTGGYLPGQLLPTMELQITYYAIRSFWVETGLQFESKASELMQQSSSSSSSLSSSSFQNKSKKAIPTPMEQLQWWQEGVEQIFEENDNNGSSFMIQNHPTLRLVNELHHQKDNNESSFTGFTKCHFDDILKGRISDLEWKQYPTIDHLERHAMESCGSITQLVLEGGAAGMYESKYPKTHQAAKTIGMVHGLTNALRTSIPIVSTTGRLIIPQDLCDKYNVKSPRYLLSALGQGDVQGIQTLRLAVQDIVEHARMHLETARLLRQDILQEVADNHNDDDSNSNNKLQQQQRTNAALAVLLPGLASETFLNRLQDHDYDLTNRNLRNVSWLEHAKCSANMIQAYYQQRY